MKKIIFLLSLLIISFSSKELLYSNELIKVGVVDTGLDLSDVRFKDVLCKKGHKDFTGTGINDVNGHGTHVAGLIKKYAGNEGYCLIIYKFFSENGTMSRINTIAAFSQANKDGVSIVNYSGGGDGFVEKEMNVMQQAKKTIFVVAAGNDGVDLDKPGLYYFPASYWLENEIAVGALDNFNRRWQFSNYGNKVVYEPGVDIFSTLPNGKEGWASGTSMSTAIHTGKLIKEMLQ